MKKSWWRRLAKKIFAFHAFPRGETGWDRAVEQARRIIALISQAIAEGRVTVAGEVGRAVWQKQGDEDHIYDWVADVIESGARTFIALRGEKHE